MLSTRLISRQFVFWTCLIAFSVASLPVIAQVTERRSLSASTDRFANLEEQLTNRLRAVANDQRAFIKYVTNKVREGSLDASLVVAVERYALKRNAALPFLFFERAIRYEAKKRGVMLPAVRQFATTRVNPTAF